MLQLHDESQLQHLNAKLSTMEPQQILAWAAATFAGLYQETAFGPSGNVLSDMIGAQAISVPVIFIDTLHHFDETLDLARRSQQRYNFQLHVFKPEGCESREDFVLHHGDQLWSRDDEVYDYVVKVEPARRAYGLLGARAVITGRRRSQNGARSALPIVEVESTGLVKINPLATWSFQQVWSYLRANEVPYNPLLDQGYKSIGDYHSTRPVKDGEDERAGRWAGSDKSECGLHKDYFAMRAAFLARTKQQHQQQQQQPAALPILIPAVVKAVLHTILFHRYFGNVAPKDNHILATITYASVDDASVSATVDEKIDELMQTISLTADSKSHISLCFTETKPRKAWFSKSDEEICWEEWLVNIQSKISRTERELNQLQASAEDQAKQAIFRVIQEMDQNKDHIPPIANSQSNPFPYHISVAPVSGLWSSMIKRAIRPSMS
ncbi:3'-phosphoadenylsulfate reductase [Coemansia thaxteri]|nr:3'-phosphoadenylsulfate reductase [Coemansia thaxteri]